MKYEIKGGTLPFLEIYLEAGESVSCEAGAMTWMSPNMTMETGAGGAGKFFRNVVSGESAFRNRFISRGDKGFIAFASSFPGSIKAVELHTGDVIIAQKSAFLACTEGVEMSIFLQKKIGAGFFGGEGFIMQKFTGNGIVFFEIDGASEEKVLAAGEKIIVDTGYLALMSGSCSIDIKSTGGVKNAIFGGEGLFNTVVSGPGNIVLQSMPASALAGVVAPHVSSNG